MLQVPKKGIISHMLLTWYPCADYIGIVGHEYLPRQGTSFPGPDMVYSTNGQPKGQPPKGRT